MPRWAHISVALWGSGERQEEQAQLEETDLWRLSVRTLFALAPSCIAHSPFSGAMIGICAATYFPP